MLLVLYQPYGYLSLSSEHLSHHPISLPPIIEALSWALAIPIVMYMFQCYSPICPFPSPACVQVHSLCLYLILALKIGSSVSFFCIYYKGALIYDICFLLTHLFSLCIILSSFILQVSSTQIHSLNELFQCKRTNILSIHLSMWTSNWLEQKPAFLI